MSRLFCNMITINHDSSSEQVTVPIVYSGGTRWTFIHDFSGDVYDLIGPTNLSISPLFWTIELDGTSFPYSGLYTLRIYRLTGESIWSGNLNVAKTYEANTFTEQNERDNVIFE